MKYSLVALAALATGVAAGGHGHGHHHRRHANPIVHDTGSEECAPPLVPKPCTTYVTSYLVPYTPPAPEPHYTAPPVLVEEHPTPAHEEPETPAVTEELEAPAITEESVVTEIIEVHPTPVVTTCSTTGVYTFPETTITLTSTEVVCVPTHTNLPPGEHTIGGVTTIVESQTTIICPVPTIVTEDGVITSKVTTTTFVCPTPGTYTIGPITTTLTETVDCEYPVVTEYQPGTYTQPEFTTTITETQQVITCPAFETSTQYIVPVPVETSAPESPSYGETPEEPEHTEPEYPAEEEEETPEEPEEEETVEEPVTVVPVSGDKWAITYSPYDDNRECKKKADVDRDIADIKAKGFQAIRLYSSDCGGLETVGEACVKFGLKIIAGVFVREGSGCQADEQMAEWIKWGKLHAVSMFAVANEAIFQGFCTAEQLGAYIAKAKGQLRAAGYNGPITTAEPLNILNQHYKLLCPHLDVTGVNIHPYFNPNVAPEDAGDFVNMQMKDAQALCNKPVYVLEAGWPHGGQANGKAIASPEAQRKAFKSIREKCPMNQIVVFTYRNDFWKDPGPMGVEQQFGCKELF